MSEMSGFGLHLLKSRWFMLFASLLIMSINGTGYLFGIYSNDLKSTLGYDQTTLNLVAFFKDLGGSLGIISGLINEVCPPWVVLAIGASMNFSGYFMIWLAVTGRIAQPRLWQICLCIWVGSDSQAFIHTGALITVVKNFPENRGVVLGLLKGYVGLSGAMLAQIYHALHGNDAKSLVLLVAWLPAFVTFTFLPVIRRMKVAMGDQMNELKVFYSLLYISLCLAGFLMVVIIVQNRLAFNRAGYIAIAAVVLILAFSQLPFVGREAFSSWKSNNIGIAGPAATTPITPQTQKSVALWYKNVFVPPKNGEDYTILQALFSVEMLIILLTTSCGIGGTLTTIDNLGQIGQALGYPINSIATFVSLVSIWNYLGRVAIGFSSEFLLAKYKFPRPMALALILLLACIGHLLIAFAVPNGLYIASVIIGFCVGAQMTLLFTLISEIFGLKYYSTLFQFGAVGGPIGTYALNVKVAGHLYDRVAGKQLAGKGLTRQGGEELVCDGGECYRLSFVIIAASSLFSALVCLILVYRTREFYRGDIYKRFRAEPTEHESSTTSTA